MAQLFTLGVMRVIATILFAALLTGCSTCKQSIQICPQACKPVVDSQDGGEHGSVSKAWMDYYFRLKKQQISYWVSDTNGQSVALFDYKHDRAIFESPWRMITTSKKHPLPVIRVICLRCGMTGVVIHLIYPDEHEVSIPLDGVALEHHPNFDVLYVE